MTAFSVIAYSTVKSECYLLRLLNALNTRSILNTPLLPEPDPVKTVGKFAILNSRQKMNSVKRFLKSGLLLRKKLSRIQE